MQAVKTVSSGFNGVYAVPMAARFLQASRSLLESGPSERKLDSQTLLRWTRSGLALPSLATVPGRELLLTFEDLVSLRVVFLLRAAGFSVRKIRRAENNLRKLSGEPRPFAVYSILAAMNAGEGDIWVVMETALVSATNRGQLAFDFYKDELQEVMQQLGFKKDAAYRWDAFDGISLQPDVQFGEPCLEGTRIPTAAVASMVRGGDPVSFVARAYGVPEVLVENAVLWEERVRAAA